MTDTLPPPGWKPLGKVRHRLGGGLQLVLKGRGAVVTKDVREWLHSHGHEYMQFIQNDAGDLALVGTGANGGYSTKRGYVGGGRELRAALNIEDKEPHYFRLKPTSEFEGLLLAEEIKG